MPLDNKCLIKPVAWPSPYMNELIMNIETISEFIAEDHNLQSVILQLVRGRQNLIDSAYDGFSDRRLNGRLRRQLVFEFFLLISPDVWKGGVSC
ncbi:hypothetical protein TNCV_581431 [Trichonephila clavipes]|nr:hypothetical protein TNCV_581431 [Trichonephila clavipes]